VATLALEMSAQDSGGVGLRGAEAEDEMPSGPPKFEESIYALSTAPGMGGIAVIRVSGPDALSSLARMSKPGSKPPQPRYATLRTLLDPASGDVLDQALVLFFPGPRSFTGEDVVELHVHGGVAIVNSVLAALSEAPGLRLAVRGEFTRRAFLNGRMDLLEAEALNDLIHAETAGQQKQAMRQMSGEHRKMYSKWRTDVRAPSVPPAPTPPRRPRRAAASPRRRVGAQILRCLSHINAFIDYGDSDGLEEEEVLTPVREDASKVIRQIERHLADGRRGEVRSPAPKQRGK
jgi:tRNA modification GTPase